MNPFGRAMPRMHAATVAAVTLVALSTLSALSPRTARAEDTQQRRRYSADQSRIDTTLALTKGGTVSVTATSGDIIVTGWTHDDVHVRSSSDRGTVRVQASGSRIEIGGMRGDSRIEISVPLGARVIANAQSGDVSIHGTRGAVEVHAQSGDVQIEDVTSRLSVTAISGDLTASAITGDIDVSSVSGDVHLSDVRGDVGVGTVSGEISLRNATTKVFHAKTTSGDIIYDGLIDPAGRYDFSAHSGDIRLHVQRDVSAQISVSTWSGSIDSDFPITLKPGAHGIGSAKAKGLSFAIGAGTAHIVADTFSGDINLSANGHGATVRRE